MPTSRALFFIYPIRSQVTARHIRDNVAAAHLHKGNLALYSRQRSFVHQAQTACCGENAASGEELGIPPDFWQRWLVSRPSTEARENPCALL